MKTTPETSFGERTRQRARDIELEEQRHAEQSRNYQERQLKMRADLQRRREIRSLRDQNNQGFSAAEVWGQDSSEAQACQEFLSHMRAHNFPGSVLLARTVTTPAEYTTKRRWLSKKRVQLLPETSEVVWESRGYPIGYSSKPPYGSLDRVEAPTVKARYPYIRSAEGFNQDVYLCEDGTIWKLSVAGEPGLLNALHPDEPELPAMPNIGAVTGSYDHFYGGKTYFIADQSLEDLLVDIAAYHTTETQERE